MKTLLLALTLFTAAAQAATFSPAVDGTYNCISYCTGYVTDDPATTVDWANVTVASTGAMGTVLQLVISVNGVTYKGYSTTWSTPQPVTGTDGTTRLISASWSTTTRCVRSGRGQTCTQRRFVTSGTV